VSGSALALAAFVTWPHLAGFGPGTGSVLAVAVSFFALGAALFYSAVLLLLNPRGPSVRWHLPFQGALMLWLLGQGVRAAGGGPLWGVMAGLMGIALPGLFVAFGYVERTRRTRWAPAGVAGSLIVALGFAYAFYVPGVPGGLVSAMSRVLWLWMLAGWTSGAWLIWVARADAPPTFDPADKPAHPQGRWLNATLSLAAALCLVLALFFGGLDFRLYAMPLITVGLDFLVFVGIAQHNYYDIEVRVRRSGDLAAGAAEAERLAVVGELAAVVAHEVRNPLTGVRSLAQRLAEEVVDDERRRRWAGVILEETSRVERLVSNLLEMARRAPRPDVGVTPLGPLFEDLALLAGARAARAGVTLESDAGDLTAGAPREALAQALMNLLLNAIAYSPHGGRVRLLAELEGEGGTRVCIRVLDQGPGVPGEERERIFEPFQSGRAGGTGLGLSVVRRLARELEWGVEVDDAPGGGAEFRLHVPLAAPGGGGRSRTATSPAAPAVVAGGIA